MSNTGDESAKDWTHRLVRREMTPSTFGDIVERAVEDATDPKVRQSQLTALTDRVDVIADAMKEVTEGMLRAEVHEEQRKIDMQRMRDDVCAGEVRVQSALEQLAQVIRDDRKSHETRLTAVEKQSRTSAAEIATAKIKLTTAMGVATFIGAGIVWLAGKLFDAYTALKGMK